MATKRLRQDYLRLERDPVPYVKAAPNTANILEWHYVVQGPEDTPYHGGYYHGKLIFPRDYPFKPPRIIMLTPNGRFEINTRLCLSISDFHPDSWNPAWSVATILTGLLSFMVEQTATLGSIQTSTDVKRKLAISSWSFNLKDKNFCQLFPTICEDIKSRRAAYLKEQEGKPVSQPFFNVPNAAKSIRVVEQGYCNGIFANLVLVFGLIAFAAVVKMLV